MEVLVINKNRFLLVSLISLLFIFGTIFYLNNRSIVFTGESSNWTAKYTVQKNDIRNLEVIYKDKIKNGEEIKYICKIIENGDEITRIEDSLAEFNDKIIGKSNIEDHLYKKNNKYLIIIEWNNKTEKISLFRK